MGLVESVIGSLVAAGIIASIVWLRKLRRESISVPAAIATALARLKFWSIAPNKAPPTSGDWAVHFALHWIATRSAWMQWQDAQHLANNGRSLGEMNKMHRTEDVFRTRAEKGELTIRGPRRDQLDDLK